MLVVGVLVTMGIGTSFGTIPIIAAIYTPLAIKLGFTAGAAVCLVAAAAALVMRVHLFRIPPWDLQLDLMLMVNIITFGTLVYHSSCITMFHFLLQG